MVGPHFSSDAAYRAREKPPDADLSKKCGKEFSGFSFGSNPAAECKDCRKATAAGGASPASLDASSVFAASGIQPSTPVVTFTLIALNVLIYVGMGLSGVSWTDPSVADGVRWGGISVRLR